MPPYSYRRSTPLWAKALIVVLSLALLATTGALVQTRRQGGANPGATVEAAADPHPSAVATSTAPERDSDAAPVERAAMAVSFPAGSEGRSAAEQPSEAFLSVGIPGEDYTTAYVVDRGSGRVLYEYAANRPVPTASMAKMMTSLIVMEEIDAGRLALDDTVRISALASTMGGSQIYAREGQTFTVETLLAATMVQSANDAATALAEKVAGGVQAFADRMNQRARELGLEGSTFYDPHGLPNPDGREDVMTARDLAVLGHTLMRYPLMREYAATATLPFENATFTSGMTNPNRLLGSFEGAYGIKTGYTGSAGFSITAAARRGDTDLIAVVTGASTSRGPRSSFELAGRMLDAAFRSWSTMVAVREGEGVGEVPVRGGMAPSVPAVASRDVSLLASRGEETAVEWSLEPRPLDAPVAAGDTVGAVVVRDGDREVARVPAMAARPVEARPWWRFWGG